MKQLMEQVTGISNGHEAVVDKIVTSAVDQHDLLNDFDRELLRDVASSSLQRILHFEQVAHEPIEISKEIAEKIDTVGVLSGTGNYDQPIKPADNAAFLEGKLWAGGWDRARMSRGANLARRIAEVRSGVELDATPLRDVEKQKEATKKLIAEYGPSIVYNGYFVETAAAEALLDRPSIIIPKIRAKIIHVDLKVTTDQVKAFEYPDDSNAPTQEVAIVSHAPHLGARVLHIMGQYDPFTKGSVPYVSPVPTARSGVEDFRLIEVRGLLAYIFIKSDASVEPHAFSYIN